MKKPSSGRLRKGFFGLMFLLSLSILIWPYLCSWISSMMMGQEAGSYEIMAAEQPDYTAYWEKADEYNRYLKEKTFQYSVDESEKQLAKSLLKVEDSNILATIEIDKIQLHIPVYRGTDEKQLQSGAGWLFGSSAPTGEPDTHVVLTAHSGLVTRDLFTRLDELEEGDVIRLSVLDRKLEYTVISKETVLPDETDSLYIEDKKDLLTLYTCTPVGVNSHRLLVHAERAHDLPKTAENAATALFTGEEMMVILLAASGGTLLLLQSKRVRKTKPGQ